MLKNLMRLCILLLIAVLPRPGHAETFSCLSIFSTDHRAYYQYTAENKIKVPADQVYGSQDGIGHQYAIIKALKEAGLDSTKSLADLSKKEVQALFEAMLKEVKNLPAVISPQGRVFLLDGHHDFYVLSKVAKNLATIEIKLNVIKDFSQTGISMADFKNELIKNGWAYGDINKIVDQASKIADMPDHMERSQMGLALLQIAETYDVPLKGKYFAPFLQFRLVDFLKSKGLYNFTGLDSKTIEQLANLLITQREAVDFLYSNKKPDAPKELHDFLIGLGASI